MALGALAKPSNDGSWSSRAMAVIGLLVCIDSVAVLMQLTASDGGCGGVGSSGSTTRVSTAFLASLAIYFWISTQPHSVCWRSSALSVQISARSESKHADNWR